MNRQTDTNISHGKSLCTFNKRFYYVMPYTNQTCPNHPDKGHRKIMFTGYENWYLLNTGQFTFRRKYVITKMTFKGR